jgi:S-adenosylmethionine synthetase
MRNIIIESLEGAPVDEQQVELVERKGLGHPDSICDAIMEQVSVALCRVYVETFGRIMHHNLDKGLLVAGITEPRMGGGKIVEPMRFIFGDRAISEWKGKQVPIHKIAIETAKSWFDENLRFVDAERHLVFQSEIKPGSPELTDIFERELIGANDTSAAVGYAPVTETERVVYDLERYLNSKDFKERFPETGEDVKVMGYRHDRHLILTVAMAFIDRFIESERWYFARKEEIVADAESFIASKGLKFDNVTIDLNTLDTPGRGEEGMYLTVLGTSAEGGDCGQVGRGNKVNGVIALNRPMSTEAAAGKNPISHVGKIYNLLSHRIANQVYEKVPGIREVYIWLCSQIGEPIDQPLIASAQLILQPGTGLETIQCEVEEVIEKELADIYEFSKRLAKGELSVW